MQCIYFFEFGARNFHKSVKTSMGMPKFPLNERVDAGSQQPDITLEITSKTFFE